MACKFGFHIEPKTSLFYLVRSNEKKVVWLNSSRRLKDYIWLYGQIKAIAKAINEGVFWKNQDMSCSWYTLQHICFAENKAVA